MDQEQPQQTQEEFDAEVESAFNQTLNPGDEPELKVYEENPKDESISEGDGEQEVKAEEVDTDPVVFGGLRESQVKTLLERAARVDAIEEQLRKAHGKIGELNGSMIELRQTRQQPAAKQQQSDNELLDDSFFEALAADYPELPATIEQKAQRMAQEILEQQGYTQQPQERQYQQPVQSASPDPYEIQKAIGIAVMDATHSGWRETVQSQDFQLWLATQPERARTAYENTVDPSELWGIINGFNSHSAAIGKTTRNRQRLDAAIVPDARSGKVSHAMTEEEAMIAAFNSGR
jgi:hypothetical protein